MIKKLFGTVLFLCVFLFTKAQTNETTLQYIKTYCGIAVTEMQRTGVPAAVKLAQGVLETMSGQSPLVIKSNNHFGIKCKQGYEGPYVLHDDDRPQERFMKYEDAGQSYKDHSDFLKGRSRYAGLFELDPTDYSGWAYGLKKAGYATNPKYPQLLIGIIERYNLAEYTLMGLGKAEWNEDVKTYIAKTQGIATPTHAVAVTKAPAQPVKNMYPEGEFLINNTKVVVLNAGASLTEIANKYNITVDRLHAMNDFGFIAEKVQKTTLVFLQLKRTVCEKAYHEVLAGENIYDIAQAEGIRLESLLKLNNLGKYDSPAIGAKLKLRDDSASLAKN
ncbi:glucosaminidase domain-containing protein [Niabella hibiscisoli]|uniref:glucosaminidase domain-containing protein n=1 Tax=Niabella hibiscisoli TaxID=1825928 RepID=UPI001F0E24C6|nr:glucosaminidase domain-containing protein [Niabella hibiscisoli]MCH5718404.1 glucosaminidase domain-containing protein [Niabella hibiscisoli]